MPGIVVGVDGSTGSLTALEWAAREAAVRQAALTVVTVHPVAAGYWTGSPIIYGSDQPLLQKAEQGAQDATEKVLSQLGDQQPASVTIHGVSGIVAAELMNEARDADLLVVGARGGGGFAALRLGSVSMQVTGHAACPVVVVHS